MERYDHAAMADAEACDIERARRRGGRLKPFGKSGRLRMQVDLREVMNAVNTEGREVLSADADEYWRDMRRRHPEIDCMPDIGAMPAARAPMRNRFGRVKERKIYK